MQQTGASTGYGALLAGPTRRNVLRANETFPAKRRRMMCRLFANNISTIDHTFYSSPARYNRLVNTVAVTDVDEIKGASHEDADTFINQHPEFDVNFACTTDQGKAKPVQDTSFAMPRPCS